MQSDHRSIPRHVYEFRWSWLDARRSSPILPTLTLWPHSVPTHLYITLVHLWLGDCRPRPGKEGEGRGRKSITFCHSQPLNTEEPNHNLGESFKTYFNEEVKTEASPFTQPTREQPNCHRVKDGHMWNNFSCYDSETGVAGVFFSSLQPGSGG